MWRAQRDYKTSLDTLALVVLGKFVKCLISRLEAIGTNIALKESLRMK